MKKIFYFLSAVSIGFTFLYSFTQVDLSLTLTQASIWQGVQSFFQQIGYFNRTLSLALFLTMLILLTTTYLLALYLTHKNILARIDVWRVIIAAAVVLTFSYTAFSYDIFNYIFDAKIITEYGDNPYEQRALDYPHDPMLSFMHWTHRTYPYGPLWLGVTVPLSYLGMGFFLPTYFLFKSLAAAAFLSAAWAIEKIVTKTKTGNPLVALTLFALNPLILVESLVAAHNDIVMIAIALFAILLALQNRVVYSGLAYIVSVGIKYATAPIAPLLLYIKFVKKKNYEAALLATLILLLATTILASLRTNFQPWYLLYPALAAPLLSKKFYVIIPFITLTIGVLLQYSAYIYLGNWDPPVPAFLTNVLAVSVGLSALFTLLYAVFYKKRQQ